MHTKKKTVGGIVGYIVLGLIVFSLMIYTASRTVHFLQGTFPPSMAYVAYLALAAFDGGVIGWMIFATASSEGAVQRGISYLMIFLDLLGVVLCTVADTTLVSATNDNIPPPDYMKVIGLWGSIIIITFNVIAAVVAHLTSPRHRYKFEMDNIRDSIGDMCIEHKRNAALNLAPELAKAQADHWVRETVMEFTHALPGNQRGTVVIDSPRTPQLGRASLAQSVAKVDPHGVRKVVKNNPNKASTIKNALISLVSPTGPDKPEKGKIEMSSPEDDYGEVIGDTDEIVEEEQDYMVQGADYHDWSKADFKEHRDDMDAFEYASKYEEVWGVHPDDDQPVVKKKRGRKPKQTEKLED